MRTAALLVLLASGSVAFAQGAPCSEAKINYYNPTPDRAKHLSITTDASGTFDATRKVYSALGENHWFVAVEPVYTKKPPWTTTIFIGKRRTDKPALKITVRDHGNSLQVRWATDRLLLIEVWWGRFGMTDWLIDVDRGQVVYDELLNYYEQYRCTNDAQNDPDAKQARD